MRIFYLFVASITLEYFYVANAFRPSRVRSCCKFSPVVPTVLRKKHLTSSENENGDGANESISAKIKREIENIQDRNVGQKGRRKNYDSFGKLATFAQIIDERTGGWGLGYADTTPYDDKSIIGLLFLATNLFYFWAGSDLLASNNYLLSATVDVAGVCSMYYHWSQIHYGPDRDEVRYTLLIDYITAFITINFTLIDVVLLLIKVFNNYMYDFPASAIALGLVSVFCLFGSWTFEYGLPYLVLHGFWHIFSSLAVAGVGSELTATVGG